MEIVIIASQKKEIKKEKSFIGQKNNGFAYVAWSILMYPTPIIEMKF